jgi:hydrogenase expression/formation protein HypE
MAEPVAVDVAGWTCPAPVTGHARVVLGHGGGGTLSAELIEHVFLPAFGEAARTATPTDSAVIELGGGHRLAFTTDTYVVRPLFFPGGNIGDLAVNGTVNDLAMQGAQPLALSTAFVLEEGRGRAGGRGSARDRGHEGGGGRARRRGVRQHGGDRDRPGRGRPAPRPGGAR